MGMNFKERVVIAKQKKEDGDGQSTRCPKHKIRMEIVSLGILGGTAKLACRKCRPDLFK